MSWKEIRASSSEANNKEEVANRKSQHTGASKVCSAGAIMRKLFVLHISVFATSLPEDTPDKFHPQVILLNDESVAGRQTAVT